MEESFGYPRCGERRISRLEFVPRNLEEVECRTCGRVYEPQNRHHQPYLAIAKANAA